MASDARAVYRERLERVRHVESRAKTPRLESVNERVHLNQAASRDIEARDPSFCCGDEKAQRLPRSFATAFCGKCGSPLPHLTRSGREAIVLGSEAPARVPLVLDILA